MHNWLATSCRANIADESDLSVPQEWIQIRPEFNFLSQRNERCVKLFEIFFRQDDEYYGHRVSASYVPYSEQELTECSLEVLVERLCKEVRHHIQGLGIRETASHDKETFATEWTPEDNSWTIEVSACEYLPTVSVVELCSTTPDFSSLIGQSPLAELASLSEDTWTVNHVSCSRSLGDPPTTSVQARSASADLFKRLAALGYEERLKTWWKGPIAIRPLSNSCWGAVIPAPSFLPGARVGAV
jgi:hypothetical protein